VQATLAVTRQRFAESGGDPVPFALAAFRGGGHDRWAALAPRLAGLPKDEIARRASISPSCRCCSMPARVPPGPIASPDTARPMRAPRAWAWRASTCSPTAPSAATPRAIRLRVDAERLAALTPMDIAMGFQVKAHNPLVGLEGRADLLRKLGGVGLERPGALFDVIEKAGDSVKAASILAAVLDKFSPIWPSPMGDVWRHPAIGLVPFHKLSQWLSYSLVEPIESAGLQVVELDALTGLPEYRNGGLLVDAGAIRPKQSRLLRDTFKPGDEPIVEWRALTVALLDKVADHVRGHLGIDATKLPW
jgi:hypothetical protein